MDTSSASLISRRLLLTADHYAGNAGAGGVDVARRERNDDRRLRKRQRADDKHERIHKLARAADGRGVLTHDTDDDASGGLTLDELSALSVRGVSCNLCPRPAAAEADGATGSQAAAAASTADPGAAGLVPWRGVRGGKPYPPPSAATFGADGRIAADRGRRGRRAGVLIVDGDDDETDADDGGGGMGDSDDRHQQQGDGATARPSSSHVPPYPYLTVDRHDVRLLSHDWEAFGKPPRLVREQQQRELTTTFQRPRDSGQHAARVDGAGRAAGGSATFSGKQQQQSLQLEIELEYERYLSLTMSEYTSGREGQGSDGDDVNAGDDSGKRGNSEQTENSMETLIARAVVRLRTGDTDDNDVVDDDEERSASISNTDQSSGGGAAASSGYNAVGFTYSSSSFTDNNNSGSQLYRIHRLDGAGAPDRPVSPSLSPSPSAASSSSSSMGDAASAPSADARDATTGTMVVHVPYKFLPIPLSLIPLHHRPTSLAEHRLVETTARRVAAAPQLEVMLRLRHSSDASFGFLVEGHRLHAYYRHLKERATATTSVPAATIAPTFLSSGASAASIVVDAVDWPEPQLVEPSALEQLLATAISPDASAASGGAVSSSTAGDAATSTDIATTATQQQQQKQKQVQPANKLKGLIDYDSDTDGSSDGGDGDGGVGAAVPTAGSNANSGSAAGSRATPSAAASSISLPTAGSTSASSSLAVSAAPVVSDTGGMAVSSSPPSWPSTLPEHTKEVMQKLLEFCSKSGPLFVGHVMSKEKNNPKFSFLQSWSPWYPCWQAHFLHATGVYRSKVEAATIRKGPTTAAAAAAVTVPSSSSGGAAAGASATGVDGETSGSSGRPGGWVSVVPPMYPLVAAVAVPVTAPVTANVLSTTASAAPIATPSAAGMPAPAASGSSGTLIPSAASKQPLTAAAGTLGQASNSTGITQVPSSASAPLPVPLPASAVPAVPVAAAPLISIKLDGSSKMPKQQQHRQPPQQQVPQVTGSAVAAATAAVAAPLILPIETLNRAAGGDSVAPADAAIAGSLVSSTAAASIAAPTAAGSSLTASQQHTGLPASASAAANSRSLPAMAAAVPQPADDVHAVAQPQPQPQRRAASGRQFISEFDGGSGSAGGSASGHNSPDSGLAPSCSSAMYMSSSAHVHQHQPPWLAAAIARGCYYDEDSDDDIDTQFEMAPGIGGSYHSGSDTNR